MEKNLTEELEERHTPGWARPYGTGPMAPWYASGDEDDEGEEAETEDEQEEKDGEEDEGEEGKDEWKPPTQQEWRKLQRALKRANKRDADLRNGNGDAVAKDDAEAKAQAAKEEGKKESDGRWKPIVVRQAAKAAFAEAGVSTAAMKRVLKMLDLDEIDIDDEGEVDGLDEQIADIKDELPELFSAPRRSAKSVDGGNKKDGAGKAKSSASVLAARLTGGR